MKKHKIDRTHAIHTYLYSLVLSDFKKKVNQVEHVYINEQCCISMCM